MERYLCHREGEQKGLPAVGPVLTHLDPKGSAFRAAPSDSKPCIISPC